jgi:GNAT superfamily N-acetyltransferase
LTKNFEPISSFEQFKALHKEAMISGKKRTNFLLPDIAVVDAINASRLLFERIDNQLSIIIRRERGDYLYIFTGNPCSAIVPSDLHDIIFSFYGQETIQSEWRDFALNNNLHFYTRALRMSCKTINLNKTPLRSEFHIELKDIDYKGFSDINAKYFDPIRDNKPEEWEWEEWKKDKDFLFIYCETELAGIRVVARHAPTPIPVHNLAVMHGYRRRGVAQMLLSAGLEETGITNLQLWVHADNEPARKLYDKCGYTYDGTYNEYYINQ